MILSTLEHVTAADFTEGTGWCPREEGLCRGEVCVPAPDSLRADGTVDIEIATQRLGMPVVHDEPHQLWALGSSTIGGKALPTATAADPLLLTRDGDPFRLSSLHGRKVLLVAWSSY